MQFRVLVANLGSKMEDSMISSLQQDGFHLTIVEDPLHVDEHLQQDKPQLIILKTSTTSYDAIQVCTSLSMKKQNIPILFLTTAYDEVMQILALESGADVIVTMPISSRELMARIRSLFRRVYSEEWLKFKMMTLGKLVLYPDSVEAYYEKKQLQLTPIEFRLLEHLMKYKGRIITKEHLIRHIWKNKRQNVSSRVLDVHISNLRAKIPGKFIKTVHGSGYRILNLERT